MLCLYILFLNIILFNLGYSTPYPGTISQDQLENEPIASIYGYLESNVLQPFSGCNKFYNPSIHNNSIPLVVLNQTAYFSMIRDNDQVYLSVVTNNGLVPLELQKNLQTLSNSISSTISYDDYYNSFIFLDSLSTIYIYSIDNDYWTAYSSFSRFSTYSQPYYDYKTKNYYVPVFTEDSNNNIVQQIMTINMYFTQLNFITISDFKLPYSIDQIFVTGYNKQIVLFGNNKSTNNSYLYLLNPNTNDYQLLSIKDYSTTMISGINSQYLLFVNSDGSITELFNLQNNETTTFKSTCTETSYSNSFITSIIPKTLFSN